MVVMPEAKKALLDLVRRDKDHECPGLGAQKVCVRIVSVADLPSRFGDFRIVAFWNNRDAKEHVAILRGDVIGAEDVPTRMHSECLTGDVIGSLRCDCRDQLEAALRKIGSLERGIVLYLRQEGRGIGLINKIRASTRSRPTSPSASGTTNVTTRSPHTCSTAWVSSP
jgi:GTP cyclohydrolase II